MSTIIDCKRFISVVERPYTAQLEQGVVAIAEALRAKPSARHSLPQRTVRKALTPEMESGLESPFPPTVPESKPQTAFDRFLRGMDLSNENWREGVGYDLTMLKTAGPHELAQIEDFLVSRPVYDWRDVQALATLDSPRARALLRRTLSGRDHTLAAAVRDHAPGLVSEKEQTKTLVAALTRPQSDLGTIQVLFQVEQFHPPDVVDALFRGVLACDGKTAVHFAAMLMYVRGKAKSSFDWDQRPFFLKFNTEIPSERETAFRELCEKLGVDGTRYLVAANAE